MMQKVLGDALKSEREAKGISLEEIARETHLPLSVLQALEDEDLASLPADFYGRYYLKSVLQCIGTDEADFLAKHREQIDALFGGSRGVPVERVLEKIEYSKFHRRGLWFAVILLVVAGGGVFLAKPWRWIPGLANRTPTLPADSWPIHWPKSGSDADFQPIAVSIHLVDRCWISAARGGVKVVEKTFEKGESLSLAGYQLTIQLGNPAAAEMSINGKKVTLPQTSGGGATLRLQPSTITELFK